MSNGFQQESASQQGQRDCRKGYACGETCIAKSKVCLKKLSTARAKEISRKLTDSVKLFTKSSKSPDLITDV